MASPVARRSGKEALHAYIETLVTWKMWDKPDTTSGHLKNTTLLVFVFFPLTECMYLEKIMWWQLKKFYIFSMVYLGFRWTLFDEHIVQMWFFTTNQNFTKNPPELRIGGCLRLQSEVHSGCWNLRCGWSLRGCFFKKKQQSEKIRSREALWKNMFYVRMWHSYV